MKIENEIRLGRPSREVVIGSFVGGGLALVAAVWFITVLVLSLG